MLILKRLLAVCVAIALAGLCAAVPAQGAGGSEPNVSSPKSTSAGIPYDPVAEHIAATTKVEIADAQRRIETQDQVIATYEASGAKSVDGSGGLWIDADGLVNIGATTDDASSKIRARMATKTDQFKLVLVRQSYAELESELKMVTSLIDASKDGIRRDSIVGINTASNRVELELPSVLKDDKDALKLASGLAASRVKVSWTGTEVDLEACTSTGPYCDELRGGVKIKNGGYCTAGFYAKSRSDGKGYMLTAGHCASGTWKSNQPSSTPQERTVGNRHNAHQGAFGDFAIVAINNELGWFPKPRVVVLAGPNTTENFSYSVTGTASSYTGLSVCHTGANTGTNCGVVTHVGVTVDSTGNLARVDYCSGGGDSGGPVYRLNKAYGLHMGTVRGAGSCDTKFYSGIAAAENILNVNVHLE